MEPLNPFLFRALNAVFGKATVCNDGQERRVYYAPDYTSQKPRLRAYSLAGGEEYRLNCPFCGDSRGRLYVNHAHGVFDAKTNSTNYHLLHCFNEQCHEKPENRDRFQQMLITPGVWKPLAKLSVQPEPTEAARIDLPKPLVPVNQLNVDHPAAQYLVSRNFDLNDLSERWCVGYCENSQDTQPMIRQRIVIPLYRLPLLTSSAGPTPPELAGWIARVVGPDATGPKYLFSTGVRKAKLLYGLPQALQTSGPVAVCEGPTDVWRFQTNAVALLGKSMSEEQRRLIQRHLAGRPIVIALDNDAKDEADGICDRLKACGLKYVRKLELPLDGKDPADFSRDELSVFLDEPGLPAKANHVHA